HRRIGLPFDVRKIILSVISEPIEKAPYARFTKPAGAEIQRRVSLGKTEILVNPAKIPLLAGKRHDMRRIQAIFLVSHVKPVNTRLIGMGRDAIIRNTHSHPHRSADTGSLANHLHYPNLIRVCNSERLPSA